MRLIEGSGFADLVNDVAKTVKYFPRAVNLAVDCTICSNIHCLHFYPRARFSYRIVISIRVYDQTWTFIDEHCSTTLFKRLWKSAISSLDTGVGSRRRRLAENEAFAMAS